MLSLMVDRFHTYWNRFCYILIGSMRFCTITPASLVDLDTFWSVGAFQVNLVVTFHRGKILRIFMNIAVFWLVDGFPISFWMCISRKFRSSLVSCIINWRLHSFRSKQKQGASVCHFDILNSFTGKPYNVYVAGWLIPVSGHLCLPLMILKIKYFCHHSVVN